METQAIAQEEEQEDSSGKSLHDGIANGYGFAAVAAFPGKHQIAHQRNIVVEGDGVVAVRAVGTGLYDGFITGQSMDEHIVEASETATEKESKAPLHH
jgi:hypothetical protein